MGRTRARRRAKGESCGQSSSQAQAGLKLRISSERDGVEELEVHKLDPDVGDGREQEVAADEYVEQFHAAAHPAAELADRPG